jgi:hypothetical protein
MRASSGRDPHTRSHLLPHVTQVDYLKGDADLEDLQGLTREEMARGLQKVGGFHREC